MVLISKREPAASPRRLPFTAKLAGALVAVGLLAGVQSAQAADWFVRPNNTNYGAGTGKSWSDAFSGFSSIRWSSVNCGDTVWVSSGTYTQTLNVSKSCSSSTPLQIKRVTSADQAVAANVPGWSAGLDGQVQISNANPGILVPSGGSIYIDGRTTYGIKVNIVAGGGDGTKAATSASVDNLRLSNVEINGPTCAPARSCKIGAYGINYAPSSYNVTNLLISHVSVHSVSEALRASNWNGAVIEYADIYDISNDGVDHEDTMYSYPSSNVTMRYSFIHNVPNDGIFFEYGGAVNFRLYGNVFYNCQLSLLTVKPPGNFGPMLIYNNVFATPSPAQYGWVHASGVVTAKGTEFSNNVLYNVDHDFPNAHNNAYNYTTLNGYGWPSKEPGSFTFTGDGGMANIAGGDAHISSGSVLRNRGATLTADGYLNKDMDGNVRGADGTFDIGAFEYPVKAGGAPNPPLNVKVQ